MEDSMKKLLIILLVAGMYTSSAFCSMPESAENLNVKSAEKTPGAFPFVIKQEVQQETQRLVEIQKQIATKTVLEFGNEEITILVKAGLDALKPYFDEMDKQIQETIHLLPEHVINMINTYDTLSKNYLKTIIIEKEAQIKSLLEKLQDTTLNMEQRKEAIEEVARMGGEVMQKHLGLIHDILKTYLGQTIKNQSETATGA
jgi:hypothetical protein